MPTAIDYSTLAAAPGRAMAARTTSSRPAAHQQPASKAKPRGLAELLQGAAAKDDDEPSDQRRARARRIVAGSRAPHAVYSPRDAASGQAKGR